MNKLIVIALGLLSATAHAQSVLYKKLTLEQMKSNKSAYVRADLRYPLGEVVGSRLMWRMIDHGFQNVSIEIPAQMVSAQSSELYYGTSRVGSQHQLSTFIKQAQSSSVTLTLKLVINDNKRNFIGPVEPADAEQFYEMYRQFISGYAKLAEKTNAQEVVLGSNLELFACKHPELMKRLYLNLTRVYSGRVRMDASSIEAGHKMQSCLENTGIQVDGIGIDLRNPGLDEANAVLASGFQVSYLGFNGDAQVQFNQLSTVLNTLNRPTTPWGLTISHYSTDPVAQGPFDTSDSILGKISEEAVRKWLSSF